MTTEKYENEYGESAIPNLFDLIEEWTNQDHSDESGESVLPKLRAFIEERTKQDHSDELPMQNDSVEHDALDQNDGTPDPAPKRGRGRPRKSIPNDGTPDPAPKRGRGRPRKSIPNDGTIDPAPKGEPGCPTTKDALVLKLEDLITAVLAVHDSLEGIRTDLRDVTGHNTNNQEVVKEMGSCSGTEEIS